MTLTTPGCGMADHIANDLKNKHWIQLYIHWELLLIKELGYDVNLLDLNNTKKVTIEINNRLIYNCSLFSMALQIVFKNCKEIF